MFHEAWGAFLVWVVASVQDSLAAVRLYHFVIGVGLFLCSNTIVLASPIIWYKIYLGGVGSTLGGTQVLSS